MQPIRKPPPSPTDPAELRRVEHTRFRVRVWHGEHVEDVRKRTLELVGAVRTAAWGDPDLSSAPAVASARALATLYDPMADDGDAAPTVTCELDETAGPAMAQVLDDAGLWPLMTTYQAQALALREMLLRADVDGVDNRGVPRIRFRPVTPDLVEARPDPRDPSRPIEIREWVERPDEAGRMVWTREVWSIAGGVGEHRILSADGEDVSERYGLEKGGAVGEKYPLRRLSDGAPLLPYVVHHAELSGALWDPLRHIELWEGTLTVSVWWTLLGHLIRNCAHGQRYMGNATVDAAVPVDGGTSATRNAVVADPGVVISMRPIVEGQPMEIGQWEPSADPEKVFNTVVGYERRLHSAAGLDPADIQRVSGDPRSGYALEVSDAAKLRSALRYAPTFRLADRQVVALVACLYNVALGWEYFPEDRWDVEHAPIRALRRRREAAAAAPVPRPAPNERPAQPQNDDPEQEAAAAA